MIDLYMSHVGTPYYIQIQGIQDKKYLNVLYFNMATSVEDLGKIGKPNHELLFLETPRKVFNDAGTGDLEYQANHYQMDSGDTKLPISKMNLKSHMSAAPQIGYTYDFKARSFGAKCYTFDDFYCTNTVTTTKQTFADTNSVAWYMVTTTKKFTYNNNSDNDSLFKFTTPASTDGSVS